MSSEAEQSPQRLRLDGRNRSTDLASGSTMFNCEHAQYYSYLSILVPQVHKEISTLRGIVNMEMSNPFL